VKEAVDGRPRTAHVCAKGPCPYQRSR
jgi:hypothetical protein